MKYLFIILVLCCGALSAAEQGAAEQGAAEQGAVRFGSFDQGFLYGFLSWQKAHAAESGGVRIKAKDGKGGGGIGFQMDGTPYKDLTPVLSLTVNPGNQAQLIRMAVNDTDGSQHSYSFKIPAEPGPAVLVAQGGASLGSPEKLGEKGKIPGFDITQINGVVFVGDWMGRPYDITLTGLQLAPPGQETLAGREALAAKEKQQAEHERKQAEERKARAASLLAKGVEHGEGNPQVIHVCAVAPDIISVAIQEKEVVRRGQIPYVPEEDDEIIIDDKKELVVWRDGELVKEGLAITLKRKGQQLGRLTGDRKFYWPDNGTTGKALGLDAIDVPEAYLVSSNDHVGFNSGAPAEVSYKRKPNAINSRTFRVTVYLHLAEAMQEGKTYRVELKGLNTDKAAVDYVHDSSAVRSELVHVSHVGFRPDDPVKQARLSIWLGTGGQHDPGAKGPLACALINEADDSIVWEGEASMLRSHDQIPKTSGQRNLAKTDVYLADFSSVTTPGRYRLWVKGIGCSYPFAIDESAWREAFVVGMQGLLSHRSGIGLPKELMGYDRPRGFHPADGVKVLPIDVTTLHGESAAVEAAFNRMFDEGDFPEPLPNAWGGYMDAGDWDRHSGHLAVPALLLELYEYNPDFWKDLPLVLPEEERRNALPDILDEALWSLAFYQRLMEKDGGVRGGIECTAHPRPGEASWQESLAIGCYAPDPVSSLRFAAVAARFSRLCRPFDAGLADGLQRDALKAWAWAKTEKALAVLDTLPEKKRGKADGSLAQARALAGIHLTTLTGDRATYEADILPQLDKTGDPLPREDILFAYAAMPAELADAERQAKARADILSLADRALDMQRANAWGIACPEHNLPAIGFVTYLSVPGMISRALPRAYMLSNDEKYLVGALVSANFATGANPDNMALTTGLGPNPVQWPLHEDSKVTGQPAPTGITVYGPSDPAGKFAFENWVYKWYVNDSQSQPSGRDWPHAESMWDIFVAPSINEYTVVQCIGPVAYTWGFLASR